MSSARPPGAALSGVRVLVTRAREQAAELCARLEDCGACVIAVPVTAIEAPDSWEAVDQAIGALESYDWIVFASANAARFFVERCRVLGHLPELKRSMVAAVGPSTAGFLWQHAIRASFVPSKSIADQFVIEFPQHASLKRKRVLWPRGNLGRSLIKDVLVEQGATVDIVECYKNMAPRDQHIVAAELANLLQERQITHVVFASAQSARSFASLAAHGLRKGANAESIELEASQAALLQPFISAVIVVSIGPETSKACREALGKVDVEAQDHTMEGVVQALIVACSEI